MKIKCAYDNILDIKSYEETEYAKPITKDETIENVYGIIDRNIGSDYRNWFRFEIADNPKEEYLNQVLDIAKDRLRKQCQTLGGDAVIWCQISHFANYVTNSLSISGTAVKLKNK